MYSKLLILYKPSICFSTRKFYTTNSSNFHFFSTQFFSLFLEPSRHIFYVKQRRHLGLFQNSALFLVLSSSLFRSVSSPHRHSSLSSFFLLLLLLLPFLSPAAISFILPLSYLHLLFTGNNRSHCFFSSSSTVLFEVGLSAELEDKACCFMSSVTGFDARYISHLSMILSMIYLPNIVD